jgi:chromosome segregation ATPase
MTPGLPESADLLLRVRQQLILAQVRIMELEDVRDELAPRVAQTESLLTAAQALADQKLDEAAHLKKVATDLEAQLQHLRHVQHVTHEALSEARERIAATEGSLARERQTALALRSQNEELTATVTSLQKHVQELDLLVADARQVAAQRLDRLKELDGEVRAMKTSRSWRWTAWLRSIERALGRRKP